MPNQKWDPRMTRGIKAIQKKVIQSWKLKLSLPLEPISIDKEKKRNFTKTETER